LTQPSEKPDNKDKQMSSESKSKKRPPRKNLAFDQLSVERAKRSLLRDASRPNEQRDLAFRRMILSIPAGKVSTYGGVAAAAGYPRYHRAVARLLRTDPVDQLPWHRVLGAGGEIKLHGAAAHEQRARLKLEGVQFNGKRVDMGKFEHSLKPWELYR
jgi:methylated-DNA-protein-cysteine methyltransferase-like protein